MIRTTAPFLTLCILVVMSPSISTAVIMSTPEPAMDPLFATCSTSRLVVTSAGRERIRNRIGETVLHNGSRICPRDYPRGFSIRCDSAEENVRKARFYVDGELVRTEWRAPYHIAGNFKVFVKPWRHGKGIVEVRCKLGRKKEVSARIVIGC